MSSSKARSGRALLNFSNDEKDYDTQSTTTERRALLHSESFLSFLVRTLHIKSAIQAGRSLSAFQLFFITFCAILVVGGNAGQLISLNIWLGNFPVNSPFVVVCMTSSTLGVLFTILFLGHVIIRRPVVRFMFTPRAIWISLLAGFFNASNGIFLVYATPHTPELLQPIILASSVFWTLIGSKIAFRDTRRYSSWVVISAVVLSAGGVIAGFAPQLSTPRSFDPDKRWWTLIFAGSMIPGALYNVTVGFFVREFTEEETEEHSIALDGSHAKIFDSAKYTEETETKKRFKSDSTTVKLALLCMSGIGQVPWVFGYFPLDWQPWFGTQTSMQDSVQALQDGWRCALTGAALGCSTTFLYYIAFNGTYFCSYVGSVNVNKYSPSLCSMITQLSAPAAAMTLLIVPAWNVDAQSVEVLPSAVAVGMIVLASVLFAAWEQGTQDELKLRDALDV